MKHESLNLEQGTRETGCAGCGKKRLLLIVAGVVVVAALAVGLGVGVPEARRRAKRNSMTSLQRANEVLSRVPLIDGHNDLAWQYYKRVNNSVYSVDLTQRLTTGVFEGLHSDIPRLREGKVGGQFWACYVPCKSQYLDAVRMSLDQLDTIKKFVSRYPDTFRFVTSAQGIEDAFNDGKIASLVGLEGGHSIDSSMSTLRMFYDLGVRYMTMTHSCNTPWGDNWIASRENKPVHSGFSPFGQRILLEMNRIGMLVDLSHVSVPAMRQALRIVKAPVIYSHSSAFGVCNHYRNVPDDVLQLTKSNKGVVMINFYTPYVNCPPGNRTKADMEIVIDHFQYIKDKIGTAYIGVGADYDGVTILPEGLEDVSTYPALFARMLERGFTEDELEGIAGKNLLRAFREAERVRDQLQAADTPPDETLIDMSQIPNTTCRYKP